MNNENNLRLLILQLDKIKNIMGIHNLEDDNYSIEIFSNSKVIIKLLNKRIHLDDKRKIKDYLEIIENEVLPDFQILEEKKIIEIVECYRLNK